MDLTTHHHLENVGFPSRLLYAFISCWWGKKVNLSLCLTKHHAMKMYRGNGGIASRILDLGTWWRWSASRPGRFTARERAPGTHWIGDWVGPRAVLDAVVKREIPSPRRESIPRTPIVQPVAQRYTDWAMTALWLLGTGTNVYRSHLLKYGSRDSSMD
jgi:hypothetical protein